MNFTFFVAVYFMLKAAYYQFFYEDLDNQKDLLYNIYFVGAMVMFTLSRIVDNQERGER